MHNAERSEKQLKKYVMGLEVVLRSDDALAGVAQWTEHWPVNQEVTGSIPCQGTGLRCRPYP